MLQGKQQDTHKAVSDVNDCIDVLQKHFRDGEMFDEIFKNAADLLGEEIPMPRITARQTHRSNVSTDSCASYYKRAVGLFVPFVDTCLSQLRERFGSHSARANKISLLLPSACVYCSFGDVRDSVEFYVKFLPGGVDAVKAEFLRWQSHWSRQEETARPRQLLIAFREATTLGTYPCTSILVRIFITLPVTNSTGERSFSALKYLKNYLQSTMGQIRLNGLAHMYVNRDFRFKYDDVIHEFAVKSRRLSFV